MDTTSLPKESKSFSTSWLRGVASSRTSTRLGIGRKLSRSSISAPVGPIKNSRGPDFTRSKTFIIVEGIKDCGSSPSSSERGSTITAATKATRRISASYSKGGPLVCDPTVAKTDLVATTHVYATPNKSTKELRKASLSSRPQATLRPSATATDLPRAISSPGDENIPPMKLRTSLKSSLLSPTTTNKLPRSRTMSVLHDLKATISRPSIHVLPDSSSDTAVAKSRATSSSSITLRYPSASRSTLTQGSSLTSSKPSPEMHKLKITSSQSLQSVATFSKPPLSYHSGSSLRRQIFPDESLKGASTPRSDNLVPQASYGAQSQQISDKGHQHDPRNVKTAQVLSYWTGRYVTLHDKLSSENLTTQLLGIHSSAASQELKASIALPRPARQSTRIASSRPNHLSQSTTTMALTVAPLPNTSITEEDAQAQRVFDQLETYCTTDEAKVSLYDWQQSFARRYNRPALLPVGGCMEDRRFMSKIFSGRNRTTERHGLSVLREATNDQTRQGLAPRSQIAEVWRATTDQRQGCKE